jgi:hypothetical protein
MSPRLFPYAFTLTFTHQHDEAFDTLIVLQLDSDHDTSRGTWQAFLASVQAWATTTDAGRAATAKLGRYMTISTLINERLLHSEALASQMDAHGIRVASERTIYPDIDLPLDEPCWRLFQQKQPWNEPSGCAGRSGAIRRQPAQLVHADRVKVVAGGSRNGLGSATLTGPQGHQHRGIHMRHDESFYQVCLKGEPGTIDPGEMTVAVARHLGVPLDYELCVASLRTDNPLATLRYCSRARALVRSPDMMTFEPIDAAGFQRYLSRRWLLKWIRPDLEALARLVTRDYQGANPPAAQNASQLLARVLASGSATAGEQARRS